MTISTMAAVSPSKPVKQDLEDEGEKDAAKRRAQGNATRREALPSFEPVAHDAEGNRRRQC